MATDFKRFTISVTPDIEADLDIAKKDYFYKATQNEMIRALIIKGLNILKTEGESSAMRQKSYVR
ncbi:MAG: hypothetical protein WCD89_09105 [Anaerocolumna sp.]